MLTGRPNPVLLQVPQLLAHDKHLASVPEHALHNTMLAANWQLHRSPVDDTLSGSTVCAALLQARARLGVGRGEVEEGVPTLVIICS